MGSSIFRIISGFIFLLLATGVELSAQVSAGFTINTPSYNCNPAVYTFTNTSSGVAPLTYAWNFGVFQGVNSVFQNPGTTYLGCGTFNVKLLVTNGFGQQDSSIQAVTIHCSPTATFTTPDSTGCVPFATTFTSTSIPGSGTITTYLWDFGDGYTGSGSDPMHTYTEAGCKNITLIVTNSFGCTNNATVDNALCTFAHPVADFTDSGSTTCATPAIVNYQNKTDSGVAPYTYQWIFQGGVPATSTAVNPSVTYNAAGNYSTTLITSDAAGCSDTVVKTGFINIPANTADFTLSILQGCTNSSATANGISSGAPVSWKWVVSPATTINNDTLQNPVFTFTDSGTYNICLTITYSGGCTAQKCSTVVIHPGPTANYNITGNLNTCIKPDVITFTNSSIGSGLTYAWSFPGGLPVSSTASSPPPVSYNTCGTYAASLKLTDQYGCTASYATPDFLAVTCPVASFTATPSLGCTPLTSVFNSSTSTGNPVSWSWDFGDPASGAANTSTLQSPSHTFDNPGCYTVILTTVTAEGCIATDTFTSGICTGNKPHANFSANPPFNCADQPVYFTDSSTNTYEYTAYFWNFTGGPNSNQSNEQNPSFIYGDTGYMNISLIIANYGCADTITKDNYVYLYGPISIVQPHTSCSNQLQVTLDGTASIDAQQYSWAIPGGNPSSATTPIVAVTYPAAGIYPVTLLTIDDSTGCQYIQTVDVKVEDVIAQFTGTPLSGCTPLNSCMSNTSGGAVSYKWIVTDSAGVIWTAPTTVSPCFDLTDPGLYNVELIATDSIGCTDTLYKPDYISVSNPITNFSGAPLTGCVPLTVNFTNLSSSSAGTIINQEWNFGDNSSGVNDTSSLQSPSHTYNNIGNYTVSLEVTDNIGCSGSLSRVQYVQTDHLNAGFTQVITNSCLGTQGCFTIDSPQTELSYHWNFGDGDTSTLAGPCHNYFAGGTYTTTLILSDTSGCVDSASSVNIVNVSKPHAVFVADTTSSSCPPLQVSFSNLSTAITGQSTYFWMFGDGQVSNAQNPTHIYSVAGEFGITLIVTNQNGCQDTLTYANYVDIGGPSAYISTHPTSGCAPHYTCFTAVSSSTINYTWNFGDGTVQVSSDSVCYTYARPGTFYPELILNDGAGCVYSLPIGQVNIGGAVAYFNLDDSSLCNNGTVNFTDSSYGASPVQRWQWSFDDPSSGKQNTSSLQNPSHYFADSGTYQIILNITTLDGCTNSFSRTVIVTPPPNILFSISDSALCTKSTIFFTDQTSSSSPVVSRVWNFGDPLSGAANTSLIPNPSHTYLTAGAYTVTLTEVADNGCSDSDSSVVTVNQSPVASFTATNVCLNAQPIVFNNTSQYGNFYEWFFGDGNSSAQFAPSNTYTDSGVYLVKLTVFNNFCSDTFNSPITIFPLPVAAFTVSPPSFCGPPLTLNIQNTSTGAIDYLWNFGNNETSTITDPTMLYATLGQDTISLIARNLYLCADTFVFPITIHQKVVASFSAYDTCLNTQPVLFQNNSQYGTSYSWDFGDSINSSQFDPSHTYSDSGLYIVQLIASDNFCSDTVNAPVQIFPVPNAAFTISAPTLCGPPVVLKTQNNSTGATAYNWDFGNGLTSGSVNPVISYNSPGLYVISLVAGNVYSCKDTSTDTVSVHQKVIASFTAFDTCLNTQPIFFQNNSQYANQYFWNFGDQGASQAMAPSHTYADSGVYVVQLTAKNDFCTDTFSLPVQIYPVPTAAFTLPASYQCGNVASLNIQNTSSGAISYLWNLGNNTESTAVDPSVTYSSPGQYLISLTAENNYSCMDTASAPYIIYPSPVIQSINIAPAEGCEPLKIIVTANVTNGQSFTWNFGDNSGPLNTDSTTISYTYTDTGTFTISLQVISFKDCGDTAILTDTVKVHVVPVADFQYIINTIVDPVNGTVVFTNTSQNADSYVWNFGDGSGSTDTDPTHLYQDVNTFDVTLVAETHYGCWDSISKSIYILKKTLYVPNAFAPEFMQGNPLVKVWKPAGTGLSTYHAQIFDKWGELLWESTALTEDMEPAEGWDGTYQGKLCQQDVYVWKIDAVFIDGSRWDGTSYIGAPKKTIGSVTLIR